MAQSHSDLSHDAKEFMEKLTKRANEMTKGRLSEIAAGKEGEQEIGSWSIDGVGIIQRPGDEQGILRISIGGGDTPLPLNYCTFRGDLCACIDLLEKVISALRKI